MVSSGNISLGGSTTVGSLNEGVNLELGQSATATITMNDSNARSLAGVSSGQISMSDFYGKSRFIPLTVTLTGNTNGVSMATMRAGSGPTWSTTGTYTAGISAFTLNVNGHIYGAASTGSWTSGDSITITGTGSILGAGGTGGAGTPYNASYQGANGGNGGDALTLSYNVTFSSWSGIIGGGGGGGAGGYASSVPNLGGGGGGGGAGYTSTGGSAGASSWAGSVAATAGSAGGTLNGGAGGHAAYGSPASSGGTAGTVGVTPANLFPGTSYPPGVPAFNVGSGGNSAYINTTSGAFSGNVSGGGGGGALGSYGGFAWYSTIYLPNYSGEPSANTGGSSYGIGGYPGYAIRLNGHSVSGSTGTVYGTIG